MKGLDRCPSFNLDTCIPPDRGVLPRMLASMVYKSGVRVTPSSAIGEGPVRLILISLRQTWTQQWASWMPGPIRSVAISLL